MTVAAEELAESDTLRKMVGVPPGVHGMAGVGNMPQLTFGRSGAAFV